MSDGWQCQKCNALVVGEPVRHHYRAVHQPTSFIRLPGSSIRIKVDRDPRTGLFPCPRIGCSVSLVLAQEIQVHSRYCVKPLDVYSEEPSSQKRTPSASHSAVVSTSRKTAKRSSHGPRSASARPSAKSVPTKSQRNESSLSAYSSLSTRTLRTHTAQLPQSTRTQRALIRHCFKGQMMMVSEIAEWVGVDRDTVWPVVRNEDGDDLDQDQSFLDGRQGTIINVDALKNIRPFVKGEPMDDDGWLRYGGSISEDEYDSEEEIEMQYIQPPSDVAPHRERRMSSGSDDSMSSLTSLEDEDAPGDPEHMFEDVSEPESGPPHSSASPPVSSTVYSNTASRSPLAARTQSDGAIEAFVCSLGGPSEQLLELFYEMELDSAERLDWLCRQQEDYWNDVKEFMLRKGVKLFHWLVVKKGLRERAAALAASSELKA